MYKCAMYWELGIHARYNVPVCNCVIVHGKALMEGILDITPFRLFLAHGLIMALRVLNLDSPFNLSPLARVG